MKSILLIEDNLMLAENIKILLEEENYNVFHASTSRDGFKIMVSNTIDIILCDIMLPDQDGFELFRNLQNSYGGTLPPFIFLTAKSQRVDQRKGMELGADDYITKPFTKEELINSINTQLSKRDSIIESSLEAPKKLKLLDHKNKLEPVHELSYEGYIFIDGKDSSAFVPIKNIIIIKSMKDYSQIHLQNKAKIVVRRTLKNWESILPSQYFLRVHRQTIINLSYVKKIENDSSYTYRVFLKDNDSYIKISQRYAKKLRKHTK